MDNQENNQFEQETNSSVQTNATIPAPTEEKTFNIAKKWWFWVALGVSTILLIAMLGGGTDNTQNNNSANDNYSSSENDNSNNQSNNQNNNQDNTQNNNQSNNQNNENANKPSTSNNLGNYYVVIKSFRLAEDYAGNPIVIVTYSYTNNAKNAESFSSAISTSVFQNGVGLNECYFADDRANYSTDNQYKEVKSGVTLDVEVAYELNDTTTPIEVEIEEWFSYKDEKVTKTFNIN